MNTDRILQLMKLLFWIIFIILGLRTCAGIYNNILCSLTISREFLIKSPEVLELSRDWNHRIIDILIVIVSAAKTYLTYLVIRILTKLNLNNPFNVNTSKSLMKISYTALSIGVLSLITNIYAMWLYKIDLLTLVTDPYQLPVGQFLFLGAIIYIISLIFKKGTDLQSENELTI
ncbi:DUF2975 domain-containing protein [uncultured Maribacter sp.]|uniref:DUF2975 domain-containing protein n=1 Tax=uncultured Maribacter sp. TaxID=431308 RepID=UPI00260EC9B1|nr:DUF2975 domain-containing protein [uncultured Maribacter sp.]